MKNKKRPNFKKPHEVISEKLEEKKLSQKDLAVSVFGDDSNTSQVKMRNIVKGVTERLSPDWVKSICDKLEITPNELYLTTIE